MTFNLLAIAQSGRLEHEAILLSDRILLMSNGPRARIAEIVEVTLPRGRTRHDIHHDPRFYRIRNHLVDFLVSRSKDPRPAGQTQHSM